MKSLTSLIIDYISDHPRSFDLTVLPSDLRRMINIKSLKKNDHQIEDRSYAIFDWIDYSWMLDAGWLKDGWSPISKSRLKYHLDCKLCPTIKYEEVHCPYPYGGFETSSNVIYYFYPHLSPNGSNYIIVMENIAGVFINLSFPMKSSDDTNAILSCEKCNAYGLQKYKDAFQLMKSPYI